MPEGKIPGGAVILLSLLLVTVAYSGWLYYSDQGRTVAELIPEVPDRLQGLLGTEVGQRVADEAGTPAGGNEGSRMASVVLSDLEAERLSAALPGAAVLSLHEISDSQSGDAEPREPVAGGGSLSDPIFGPAAAALAEDRAATAAGPAPTATPAPAPAPVTTAMERPTESLGSLAEVIAGNGAAATRAGNGLALANGGSVENAIGTLTGAEQDPRPLNEIPQAPSTAQLALSQAGNPRIYGSDNENARIVLRARHDSWVQVRDGQDELLLTRVLRAGDSYRVPNQTGLTLLTGNAGGLEIEVDGETLAPLGPIGSVRRNISLDPGTLATDVANP